VPGNLPIFRNSDDGGNWLSVPNTILIDSEQLESGEAMSKEFKKMPRWQSRSSRPSIPFAFLAAMLRS